MLKSLIWKKEQAEPVITSEKHRITSEDLNLGKLFSIMSKEPIIKMTPEIFLSFLTSDNENIKYRQCILNDFLNRSSMEEALEELIVLLDGMSQLHKTLKPELLVPKLMLRLKKLEKYLDIMKKLEFIFSQDGQHGNSEEFSKISNEIKKVNIETGLDAMAADIRKIKEITGEINSVTIGVNIDHQYTVREAIILSINDFKYRKSNIIDKVSCNKTDEIKRLSIAPEIDIRNAGQILSFKNEMDKEFEALLNKEIHIIDSIITKYNGLITSGVLKYRDEACMYYGALRLHKFLTGLNHEVCFPELKEEGMKIKGLYSVIMAYEGTTAEDREKFKVVKNNIEQKVEELSIIITGANDGGKTVLLESLVLVQLLFQNGMMITAESGRMQIYKKIYTHFPKDEDLSLGAGRLGEEAGRISEILKKTDDSTLVVFNEPYVTTSPTEGLDILALSLKRFLDRGACIYLVTHYLDIITELENPNKTASYVMEYTDGEKTYKTFRRAPMSESHAIDVAKTHGVDRESILKLINDKKHHSVKEAVI